MKTLPLSLVCLLLAVPAFADVRNADVAVGPYAVHVDRVEQLNKNLRFKGSVSGGANCETLDLEAFLRNENGDRARLAESVRRYDAARGVRVEAEAQQPERGSQKDRKGWYIDNLVIRCVNGGVAARHESNPR